MSDLLERARIEYTLNEYHRHMVTCLKGDIDEGVPRFKNGIDLGIYWENIYRAAYNYHNTFCVRYEDVCDIGGSDWYRENSLKIEDWIGESMDIGRPPKVDFITWSRPQSIQFILSSEE